MSSDPFMSDDAALISPLPAKRRERELTGWMVLSLVLAFFAVIIGVNAFMAHEALSTFRGVDTDSSYRAGQLYEREVAMAKAQDGQHWRVEAKVTPAASGSAALDIDARDEVGAPLAGLTATAVFARPTDRGLDRSLALREDASGHFHGRADVAAGQWDLIIELSRQDQRLFRSKNRVVVR